MIPAAGSPGKAQGGWNGVFRRRQRFSRRAPGNWDRYLLHA
jgi:hypothetical protein